MFPLLRRIEVNCSSLQGELEREFFSGDVVCKNKKNESNHLKTIGIFKQIVAFLFPGGVLAANQEWVRIDFKWKDRNWTVVVDKDELESFLDNNSAHGSDDGTRLINVWNRFLTKDEGL